MIQPPREVRDEKVAQSLDRASRATREDDCFAFASPGFFLRAVTRDGSGDPSSREVGDEKEDGSLDPSQRSSREDDCHAIASNGFYLRAVIDAGSGDTASQGSTRRKDGPITRSGVTFSARRRLLCLGKSRVFHMRAVTRDGSDDLVLQGSSRRKGGWITRSVATFYAKRRLLCLASFIPKLMDPLFASRDRRRIW